MRIGRLRQARSGEASLSDYLSGGAFLLLVASAATFRVTDYDIWWHLATGRLIAAGGGIPRSDPFSFTAVGVEWIDHEWLYQWLVQAIYGLGGVAGLVLARAFLVTLAAGVVYRFVRRDSGLSAAASALLLVPFVLAGRDRFLDRPELFTLLFSALLLTALLRRRPRPADFRRLFWIPMLFLPWANLHGGLIVGLALLALFALGSLLSAHWPVAAGGARVEEEGRPRPATVLLLLAAAAVCGLANPFFHRVYEVPFRLTALIESGIYHNLEWIRPPWPDTWLYYLLLAVALLVAAAGLRRPDWGALLPLLFLAAISARYVRNLALFSLLAPILLVPLARRWARLPGRPSGRRRRGGAAAWAAAVLLVLLAVLLQIGGYRFAPGLGVDPRRVPERAVDFLEGTGPPGNLLNAYVFGGYVSWRLWPGRRIFIDGRNEVFAELRRRLGEAVGDSRKWQGILEEYDIGCALLEYIEQPERVTLLDALGGLPRIVHRPYAVNHFPRAQWALVYWDDTAMVFLQRRAEARPLIAAHEYAHLFPESEEFQLEAFRLGWAERQGCLAELQRKLGEDPTCRRALRLLTAVRGQPGPAVPPRAGRLPEPE